MAALQCFIATVLYAVEASLVELKLSNVNPRLMTVFYGTGMFIFGLSLTIWRQDNIKEQITALTWNEWKWISIMILVCAGAVLSHFYALHNGASAVMLNSFYALLPVISAAITAAAKREVLNRREMLAIAFGAIAIYLISTSRNSN